MATPLTISLYFLFVFFVCCLSIFLSKIVDILDKKTTLSSATLGGLFLATVTSIPELVTTIAAIFVDHQNGTKLACGDILGSNIFDLFILAICLICFIRVFVRSRIDKINWQMMVVLLLQSLFALLAIVLNKFVTWKGFNFFSLGIFIVYSCAIYLMSKNKKQTNDHSELVTNGACDKSIFHLEKYSTEVLIIFFFLDAIMLIGVSIYLTKLARDFNNIIGINEFFGGALLLGAVTSAPEIVCTIHLCILKNYELTVNGIIGSCVFNKAVLFIANICSALYLNRSLFETTSQTATNLYLQIGLICTMSILFLFYCLFNAKKNKTHLSKKKILFINNLLLWPTIISYSSFLIIGFTACR